MKKKAFTVIVTVSVLLFILGIASTPKYNKSTVITPKDFELSTDISTDVSMYLEFDGTVKKLSIDGLPRTSLYIVSEKELYLAGHLSAKFIPFYLGYNCPTPVIPKGLMANGNMVAEDALTGELVVISSVRDMNSISSITEIAVDEAESQIVYKVVLD